MAKKKEISLFLSKVGESPIMQVLEYFIEGKGLDYAIQDVIDEIELSRNTVYKARDNLLKQKLIIEKRIVGKTKLFTLDLDNPIVENFVNIFMLAINEQLTTNPKKHLAKTEPIATPHKYVSKLKDKYNHFLTHTTRLKSIMAA